MNTASRRLLLFALLAALLVPATAAAQRRVISGKPPPPAEPAKAEPAKAEPAKEEPARPEPAEAEAEPEEGPATEGPVEPAVDPTKARSRVQAPVKKEPPPAPPTVLSPHDEVAAPSRAGQAVAAVPKADVVIYRRKIDKTNVSLQVRPAKPQPGRTTELTFEIVKVLAIPDPALGDRVPLENAILYATVSRDGGGAPVRYRLHPLPDAGSYGVHLRMPEKGVYRIAMEQRLVNPEIGDQPLATEFLLGIGQETPIPADDDEDSMIRKGRGRTALKVASDEMRTEGAAPLMRALGEAWLALAEDLDDPTSKTDRVAMARAVAEAAAGLAGKSTAETAVGRRELDTLANGLNEALKRLPAAAGAGKAREEMARLEVDHCARCHVKFRYQIADDISGWPKLTPKARQKDSGARRPTR